MNTLGDNESRCSYIGKVPIDEFRCEMSTAVYAQVNDKNRK